MPVHDVIVAVTKPEYVKAQAVFEQAAADGLTCVACPHDDAGLAEAIRFRGARHAVIGADPYREHVYGALPPGGVLARFGVGYDGVDLGLATERGLLCTNTPGVLDDSVAEHAMALILAAARHVPKLAEATRNGQWSPRVGVELRGKRLAVIGCGPIGCRVARIAAFGFGMTVVGCKTRKVDAESMKGEFGFADVVYRFEEAVDEADFVSLHIPSNRETRHFIDGERLAAMPNRSWLVNTARGAVVDEAALFDALKDGTIRGAALDVFEREPYQPVHPDKDLRTLPNTILTPHAGSSTTEACNRMARRSLQNIALAQQGRHAEMDLLNPEVLNREE